MRPLFANPVTYYDSLITVKFKEFSCFQRIPCQRNDQMIH